VIGVWRGADSIRPRVLERVRRLRHRGPDWSGVYCKGRNILAHERLAIVDVESGDQPLFNSSKTLALAVNGEIYNHKQLRSTLTNPSPFLTESDCEIILHLYEQHQQSPSPTGVSDFLNQLNGIFAFILLDESTGNFLIARDHMGIIPLYTGRDAEGSLWISSEMKALVDICVTFEDFPPGHYMTQDGDKVAWYCPVWHDEQYISSNPLDLVKLRVGLEDAVKRQLMSDVPYGVLLSGGLDSSLIAAIAARVCANRVEDEGKSAAWWPRLHSFSVGLSNSPDLKMARVVANVIKTVHHEFIFTVEEGLDAISDVIYHLETYDVTTIRAATPMYLMSRKSHNNTHTHTHTLLSVQRAEHQHVELSTGKQLTDPYSPSAPPVPVVYCFVVVQSSAWV
jgi:asparagine synthase (glutamine-hydrolysing)